MERGLIIEINIVVSGRCMFTFHAVLIISIFMRDVDEIFCVIEMNSGNKSSDICTHLAHVETFSNKTNTGVFISYTHPCFFTCASYGLQIWEGKGELLREGRKRCQDKQRYPGRRQPLWQKLVNVAHQHGIHKLMGKWEVAAISISTLQRNCIHFNWRGLLG